MQHTLLFLPQWLQLHAIEHLLETMFGRLILAAVLGGIIGLERELKHRPAGLRTNMFMCFGSAMFTVISLELGAPSDPTRIAAQVITGIGFIGAGSILRARGGVTGLTTAATIFVVAAIGMACGAGLYGLATLSTIFIFLSLRVLGTMERRFDLKPQLMDYYIVTDKDHHGILEQINHVLQEQSKEIRRVRMDRTNGKERIEFSVGATRSEHEDLLKRLRQADDLREMQCGKGDEIES